MNKTARFLVALALFVVGSQAHGVTFTATGIGSTPGEKLKASVVFAVSNLDLIVTLSNTGTFDPQNPADILAAIFFKINGDPKLTPISAQLIEDSSVIAHQLPLGFEGDVGGEWAYRNDLTRAPDGANEGISSAALKWFGGTKYLFPGKNLQGSKGPGGIQFGVTTLDDLPGNNRGGIKNQGLIQSSVQFVLFGLPDDFALSQITDVTLQYGTNVKQPEITGEELALIPEPSTMMLAAAGLAGVLTFARRRSLRR
jgi:hypothetical protein